MGKRTYPDTRELFITADAGGSNSARSRRWKVELQRFATRTGLTVSVSHFPPGTNKIERRLFCHITENWRGRPLVDRETVVQLIGSVRTITGLTVRAELDTRAYPVGVKSNQNARCGYGEGGHHARRLSRRLELHHPS